MRNSGTAWNIQSNKIGYIEYKLEPFVNVPLFVFNTNQDILRVKSRYIESESS